MNEDVPKSVVSDRMDVFSDVINEFYDVPRQSGEDGKPTPALRFGLSRFQIATKET
jgi:hypothetical protein